MSNLMVIASLIIFIVYVALAVKLWHMADDIKAMRKKYLEKEDKERKEQIQKQNAGELKF